MTEETTTTGTEGKESIETGNSQTEAFKRLEQKNADLQAKLDETVASKEGTETKEKAKDPEPGSAEYIKQVIKHEAKREAEVTKFLSDYPEVKEYEGEIRKRLNDESRAKIPTEEVIRGAIPLEVMLKIGASLKEKEAEDDKNGTMGGGDGKAAKKQTSAEKKAKMYMDSLPKGFRA